MKKHSGKIALVVPDYSQEGGVKNVARFIETFLEQSEFDFDIISLATSSRDSLSTSLLNPATWWRRPGQMKMTDGHRNYIHVGCRLRELEFMRYLPRAKLTRLLDGYDVIQFVTGSPAFGYVARDVRAPVLLQTATLIKSERRRLLRARGLGTLLRRIMTEITAGVDMLALKQADVVQVENAWMNRELSGRFPGKVRFNPPGVDADFFRPNDGPVLPQAERYILSVGRFSDPRKNVPLLLRAYRRLRDQLPGAPPLLLAGKTMPVASDLALLDELNLRPYVELRPDVSMQELRNLYANAALFALSSDEEGLGLVILEAMACGAPVVSTACGGPETMVVHGETGLLVPLDDAQAFAQAMCSILTDRDLSTAMSRRARAMIEERFSVRVTSEHFLRDYRLLVTPHQSPGDEA